MPVIPTIRLLFVIQVYGQMRRFVAYYRGIDRYYNFIFSGRKISREEYFAGGKFREIPFAVDIIFAGVKFRAKSKFANIAKISSTRKNWCYTVSHHCKFFPVFLSVSHHAMANICLYQQANRVHCVMHFR